MNKFNKNSAGVVLIDFAKANEKLFWQQKLFNFSLHWQRIGHIKNYQVLYYEIPWQEKDFLQFSLEKQRQIFQRILKNACKQGCVVGGVPMSWRLILTGNTSLQIPCGRELAINKVIWDMEEKLNGMGDKNVAVWGVDDKYAKLLTDKLLSAGAKLIFTGKKARSLADWYYRNNGLAIPVFQTEKAGETADGIIALNNETLKKYEDKTLVYGDVPVEVRGDWQKPFNSGWFGCGLAAALLAVGGETADGLEKNQGNQQIIKAKAV